MQNQKLTRQKEPNLTDLDTNPERIAGISFVLNVKITYITYIHTLCLQVDYFPIIMHKPVTHNST